MRRILGSRPDVLEVGSGSGDMLECVAGSGRVGCDLSIEMLRARARRYETPCVVGAGEELPFRDGRFDGVFLINVLEHVSDVERVVAECARVMREDAVWLGVTPNGNWKYVLDLAERLSLKLPEGPLLL